MLYLANWCINAMNTLGELCTLMVIWVVESFKRGVSILDSLYLAGYKESRILSLEVKQTKRALDLPSFYGPATLLKNPIISHSIYMISFLKSVSNTLINKLLSVVSCQYFIAIFEG